MYCNKLLSKEVFENLFLNYDCFKINFSPKTHDIGYKPETKEVFALPKEEVFVFDACDEASSAGCTNNQTYEVNNCLDCELYVIFYKYIVQKLNNYDFFIFDNQATCKLQS